MKNLLLAFGILFSTTILAQNWKDVGPANAFGNTLDMQIAIADDGTPYVATINTGGAVELYQWNDFTWNMIPTPFLGTATNLQLINHADTFYIGYSTLADNYQVYKFTSGNTNFTQLGNLTALNVTINTNSIQLSVNPNSHLPMLTIYRPHTGAGAEDNDVYLFDGANWNLHGNPGFNYWVDSDLYELRACSNGAFSYVLANQFDLGGAMVVPGDDPLEVNSGSRDFGYPDLGLYLIDEGAPSTWVVVTGSYIMNDPNQMEMACNPNKEPFVVYTDNGAPLQFEAFRTNGAGPVVPEPTFFSVGPINSMDVQMMNNDSAMVLYTHDPQAPENTHVLIEDGGSYVELGAPGVTQEILQDQQLDISRHTNKPYVLWWNGSITGVRTFNQAPVFNSNTTPNGVCQDAVDFVAVDEVIFDDMDNDSLGVWVVSQSPLLVQSANISVAHTQAWDPANPANKFSISVTTEPGMTGTANIDIYCTDGIDTIFTSTSFDINGLPTASISLPSNDICENHPTQVLDSYGIPSGGNFSGNGVFNNQLYPSQVAPGAYNLDYIYQDANGCKDTATQVINIHDAPQVSFAITDADCGVANGAVNATISGGTGTYSIYWSTGDTVEDINNVYPTMYYINITDGNGCYVMDAATVSSNGLSVSGAKQDVVCNGDATGSIDVTVSGSGPFSYQWSNGATTEDLSGLTAGQYELFVTDGSGCEAMESVTIVEPAEINANFNFMEATCGVSDGGITANVSGGTGPYNFQWYDYLATPFGPNANSVTGIPGGDYSVDIQDANGCAVSFNGALQEAGGPLVIPMNVQDAGCTDNGAIDIAINSQNGVQSIQWSNGPTTEDITGLTPGYYSVTVVDNMGCIGMLGVTVNPEIPAATEICVVTVDTSTNTNLIVWEKPVSTEISHWNLYRESSVAGVFQFVDSVPYADPSEYNDTIAYPHLRSWRYVLTTVNNCGVESYNSPEHKTIHLTISAGLPGDFNLHWDTYEGFNYPTYFVYRWTSQSGIWTEIGQLANSGNGSLTDTPPSLVGLNYIISIEPPMTCTSSGKATDYNSSRSNNSSESVYDPADDTGFGEHGFGLEIFPNPSEDIFKLMFDTYENYDIQVYDLSGKLVFSSSISAQIYVLDLTGFASGSYTVRIQNENSAIVEKLILR